MYYPETFFSKQVLEDVLDLYDWPVNYKLIEVSVNSMLIEFPKCSILLIEGFESKMNAYFLNEQTGRNSAQENLSIFNAIEVIKPGKELSQQDAVLLEGAIQYLDDDPSLDKVRQGLTNICILLQVYLLPCIQGDFSWVIDYNTQYPDNL